MLNRTASRKMVLFRPAIEVIVVRRRSARSPSLGLFCGKVFVVKQNWKHKETAYPAARARVRSERMKYS
eukprot:6900874-Pyramimonas_sp.AAC.1